LAPGDLVPAALRADLEARGAPILRADARPTRFFDAFPSLASGASRYFVVSPGSVWATKRYPAQSFAQAARAVLASDPALTCVVSGGPSDALATREFFAEIQTWDPMEKTRVADASACIPLEDLAAVLAGAALVLTNDSAPLHVACAVGAPVVGIYGPTSATRGHGPSGASARLAAYETEHDPPLACRPCSKHGQETCPLGHFRCMRELAPETVTRVALALLRDAG